MNLFEDCCTCVWIF